jgi:hypothetical protein
MEIHRFEALSLIPLFFMRVDSTTNTKEVICP